MFNSYATMLDLVNRKLAVAKVDGHFTTFKYHRRVMFDNLWKKHPELLEVRGQVYDNRNGNLVQATPTKSFNYGENGHWWGTPLHQPVIMYKKYNGFMAAATIYEGELIVSTTGTTSSDYAKLAFDRIIESKYAGLIGKGTSTLFEIIDESDPHIVAEISGVKLLGYRFKDDGYWIPAALQDKAKEMTFGEALELVKTDRGEGYMLYKRDEDGAPITSDVCKLKTVYYVGKKKLMRMSDNNIDLLFKGDIPSMMPFAWYNLIEEIKLWYTADQWKQMNAQQRRKVIELMEDDHLKLEDF